MWVALLLLPFTAAFLCEECKRVVDLAQQGIKSEQFIDSLLKDLANFICVEFVKYPTSVCKGAIDEMTPSVLDSLVDKVIDAEKICTSIHMCSAPKYEVENIQDFYTAVLANKPNLPEVNVTSSSRFNFLHITDLHFDLDYKEGSNENCDIPQCCREGTGNAGHWGSYKCDLPFRTFENLLSSASRQDIDFVLWTGDTPPHDIWSQSREYQLQYINTATEYIQKYFDVPVYPALGNHGCFPVNVFDYGNEQWLTQDLADKWSVWLDDAAKDTLSKYGYYSIKHKNTNLRMVILNSASYNDQNWNLIKNSTDPGEHIQWLWRELDAAEKNNEIVYIVGHIPTKNTNLSTWTYHYTALIERYHHIIRGEFFGHNHNDDISIVKDVSSGKPISVQYITPSATTYTELNPSYRIFEADSETSVITNFYQYRLNLAAANLQPNSEPEFELAYDALSEYSLPNLKPATLFNWLSSLLNNEQEMLKLLKNYETGGLNTPSSCDEKCRKSYFCNFSNSNSEYVRTCKGSEISAQDKLMEVLFGKEWVYKVY
jgi:sphingomyelin phosphodiesterase